LQVLIRGLEGEDRGNAGQVEAIIEESADLSYAGEVVIAVAAGAAIAAGGVDKAAGFVEPEVLRGAPDEFGGDGDPIDALARLGALVGPFWPCHRENLSERLASNMAVRV
jgi:hypothetical protein